jgi:hypothetical protein
MDSRRRRAMVTYPRLLKTSALFFSAGISILQLLNSCNSCILLSQFPSSNRTGAENASPFGGGGNFVIFFPASRTESSTTAFPELSIISNSVTVPSDSTFSFTVTSRVFPSAISLVGWFHAAWNRFVSIPTYPAKAEFPDPLPSVSPGPDPAPVREWDPDSVDVCTCESLPLFLPLSTC